MSGTHGHAQGNQLANRGGKGADGRGCTQWRCLYLHRQQPQADEASSRRGRRDGNVRQTAGGRAVQGSGI